MQTEQLSKNPKCEIIHTVGNTKTRITNKQLYTLGNLIERITKGKVTHCAKYIKNELQKEQLLWKIPNGQLYTLREIREGNQNRTVGIYQLNRQTVGNRQTSRE